MGDDLSSNKSAVLFIELLKKLVKNTTKCDVKTLAYWSRVVGANLMVFEKCSLQIIHPHKCVESS